MHFNRELTNSYRKNLQNPFSLQYFAKYKCKFYYKIVLLCIMSTFSAFSFVKIPSFYSVMTFFPFPSFFSSFPPFFSHFLPSSRSSFEIKYSKPSIVRTHFFCLINTCPVFTLSIQFNVVPEHASSHDE